MAATAPTQNAATVAATAHPSSTHTHQDTARTSSCVRIKVLPNRSVHKIQNDRAPRFRGPARTTLFAERLVTEVLARSGSRWAYLNAEASS